MLSLLATDFGSPLVDAIPTERDWGGRSLRGLRPPRSFKGLRGTPTNVRFGGTPRNSRGHTAAQRAGLAYEQRVVDVLSAIYEADFRRSPSILYEDRSGLRMAIPDAILKIDNTLVVIEVKLTHTERAWWQLHRLYLPLIRLLVTPGVTVVPVEICRSFDPEIRFPETQKLITSLHRLPLTATGILQWKI